MENHIGRSSETKFVIDGMLGSLAKWLRLLGYDALYLRNAPDSDLLRIAQDEKRILLTKDTRLLQRRQVKKSVIESLLVETDTLADQLIQVSSRFDLELEGKRPFCSICNLSLKDADKETARQKVPPYVYQAQERFSVCPGCGRYYWAGTHWQSIEKKTKELRERDDLSEK